MRIKTISTAILLAATLAGSATAELSRHTIPGKWLDEYLPEKLSDLKPPSYFTDLDKARQQAFMGRYKQALITVKLAKLTGPKAAWIKGYALANLGRTNEALEALADKAVADDPAVGLLTAQIHARVARYDKAIEILKKLVAKQPEALAPRFHLGLYLEQSGDVVGATKEYDQLHEQWWEKWRGQEARLFEDAESLTLLGQAFDHWAKLNGKYAANPDLQKLILKAFVQAYDIVDRSYWPAHVAAAEYYLSHENGAEAGKELKAALAGNPNDAHTCVLTGYIALAQFNFDGADAAIAAVRKIDAGNLECAVLEARSLLHQRTPKEADKVIKGIIEKNPDYVDALALAASAAALQMKDKDVEQLLAKIEKLDPHNASAYFELGEHLGAMRQYPRAEKMYEKAIDRAPWMSEARNGLGLLLTQSGDEDKAKIVLDAAYAYDPFNYRTINYLRLLDRMAKMDRVESKNFTLVFSRKRDPIIDLYVPEYMESIYADVCGVFKHQPELKTVIEIFPTHEQFSARVTGAPWIGTVGASTGRVIALATPAPGEGNAMGSYNWAQVLRHEFTHTVTLSATENRIGHWMTEGLAVMEEHSPMRWEWVPMLYNAVKHKELFSMENLTWAFVRPKKPTDRAMAYAQSAWVCEYIQEKWGRPALLKMMDEFRRGRVQEDIFPDVLGVPIKSFEVEFTAWAEKQVKGWGYDEATSKKYTELRDKAEAMVQTKQYAEALAAWEEIRTIRPMDQLPYQRLAFLYLNKGDVENAKKCLLRMHQTTVKDNRFAKRLARMCLDNKQLDEAKKYALESIYVDPYDLPAHEIMLEIAQKAQDAKAVEREEKVLPVLRAFKDQLRKDSLMPGAPTP